MPLTPSDARSRVITARLKSSRILTSLTTVASTWTESVRAGCAGLLTSHAYSVLPARDTVSTVRTLQLPV